MAKTTEGWPRFMKTYDEWREHAGNGSGGASVGDVVEKFLADWEEGTRDSGGNGRGRSAAPQR